MCPFTALVIDDEHQIRRVVRNALEAEGARVLEAADGREGLDTAVAEQPDLVILDLGLPDVDGANLCVELRAWFSGAIIVLSARHSDGEKAKLLDSGADDYVTKPFSTVEFKARIRAQLRRMQAPHSNAGAGVFERDGIVIDVTRRRVTLHSTSIHLTPIEWNLLRVLLKHAGRTLTHQQLFREVWAGSHGDAQHYLRVHVANLRRKLERDPVRPTLISTEPGVGYRLESDE